MAEVYVVQSKGRAFAKKKGCRCSGAAIDTISKKVESLIADAAGRAKGNKRQTIKASDI